MINRVLFLMICLLASIPATHAATPGKGFRILHVMSFNSPWRWTDGQFDGFKAGLGSDLKVEYKVFQLDTKHFSSAGAKQQKALEARKLIAEWKPDLVYTSDDDAVELVTKHYLNKRTPFVFSGVNKSAEDHGIKGASNITGVLEREHALETLRLLQTIQPGARRIQILSDTSGYWSQVIGRIRSLLREQKDFELVGVDQFIAYADFQQLALTNPNKADAYLFLGNFNFKDAKGSDVPYQQVHRWFVENTRIPDVSFWEDRMYHGTLAGVTVSAFEQGQAAGKLAHSILIDRKAPGTLPITATNKGAPVISLARARQLGIMPPSSQLLSSTVITSFAWDKQ